MFWHYTTGRINLSCLVSYAAHYVHTLGERLCRFPWDRRVALGCVILLVEQPFRLWLAVGRATCCPRNLWIGFRVAITHRRAWVVRACLQNGQPSGGSGWPLVRRRPTLAARGLPLCRRISTPPPSLNRNFFYVGGKEKITKPSATRRSQNMHPVSLQAL